MVALIVGIDSGDGSNGNNINNVDDGDNVVRSKRTLKDCSDLLTDTSSKHKQELETALMRWSWNVCMSIFR